MSAFFDVLNAIDAMGPEDMPSAHRLVLLFVANHANAIGRAWPSIGTLRNKTGYGRTKVAEVLEDLVAHGWLVPDGHEGRGLNKSARFIVAIGERWPEGSRAHLARSFRRAPAIRAAGQSDPPCGNRTAGQTDPPGGSPEIAPAIRPADRGDPPSAIRPADHRDPPGEHKPLSNLSFGTSLGTSQLCRGVDQQDPDPMPLFRGVDPVASDETPLPVSRVRPKKAAKGSTDEKPTEPRKPRAEVYVELFVAGLSDAGRTITRPRTTEGQQIGRIAAAHAKRDGAPLVGDDLDAWIRSTARDFARAVPDPSHHRGGLSPFGLGAWLDAGKPVQRGGVAPELPRKPLHNLPLPEPPKPLLPPPGWDGKPKFLTQKPERERFTWELSDEELDDLAIEKGFMKPEHRHL